MYKFKYIDNTTECTPLPSVTIKNTNTEVVWTDQARDFYQFLLSQGFILSEKDLADYYVEAANEMGNLRCNFKE